MALANDMTLLLNKIERRLGLTPLINHLPKELSKEEWGKIILEDSLVTFSRYYPNAFKMVINKETVDKETVDGTTYYYIKDEILQGAKLLGLKDIDWTDVEVGVPAFLAMAIMPFTYNISYGIAFGLISYIIIKLGMGKLKDIKIGTWVIGIMFAIMFFVTH